MPITGNATTTRLNRPSLTGGDEMHETLLSDGSKAPRVVAMDDAGNLVDLATAGGQSAMLARLDALRAPDPSTYDYIDLAYTGDRLDSATFKSGGAGGTVVATVALGYTGQNLTSVAWS